MTNLRAVIMLETFIAHSRAELRDLERMLAQVERGETPPELELLAGLIVVDALDGWTGPQEDNTGFLPPPRHPTPPPRSRLRPPRLPR